MPSPFSTPIIGHERQKKELAHLLSTDAVPTAVLFTGIDGIGKRGIAKAFGEALTEKSKYDLVVVEQTGNATYLLEDLAVIHEGAMAPPFEAKKKVFILDNAERMGATQANGLLKIIEEPSPTTHFLFITSRKEALLPTLRSRFTEIAFQPLPVPLIEELLRARGLPSAKAAKARGSFSLALLLSEANSPLEALERAFDAPYHQAMPLFVQLDEAKLPLPPETLLALAASFRKDPVRASLGLTKALEGLVRNIRLSTCLERIYLA